MAILETKSPLLGELTLALCQRLTPVSDTPLLDTQVLLAWAMGKPRAWIIAHPEAELSLRQNQTLEAALARLDQGEPLPYLLGRWEFYGLEFYLTPDTLIPRPETELLVEQALSWLHTHPEQRNVVDVGTGCGCIAVTLAVHLPDLHVLGIDISQPSLQVAGINAARHLVAERIELLQNNLFEGIDRQFDLICANLPYIPTGLLHSLPVYRREPSVALDGGEDGLQIISRLLESAPEHLAPGGLLLLEIEASSGKQAQLLAHQAFPQAKRKISPDLAGCDRLLVVENQDDKSNHR